MNKKNELILKGIKSKAEAYTKRVADTLEGFSDMMQKTEHEGAMRKDEKEYIRENSAKHAAATRAVLEKAAASFSSETRNAANELREQLIDSLCQPVHVEVLQQLDILTKFKIQPAKTQVENLVDLNGGNILGLQAINCMLTANKSRYRLNFFDVADYEKDLERLETFAQSADHFVPLQYHQAGCQVFKGQPVTVTLPNGNKYNNGQVWDSLSLIAKQTSFNSRLEEIDAMAQRWAADVTTVEANEISAKFKAEEAEEARIAGNEAEVEPDPKSTTTIEESSSSENEYIERARQLGRESGGGAPLSEKLSAYIR